MPLWRMSFGGPVVPPVGKRRVTVPGGSSGSGSPSRSSRVRMSPGRSCGQSCGRSVTTVAPLAAGSRSWGGACGGGEPVLGRRRGRDQEHGRATQEGGELHEQRLGPVAEVDGDGPGR